MNWNWQEFTTITFSLFAVIDIIGSVPMLISIKQKLGGINSLKATLISGALMILFLLVGKSFLSLLGVDINGARHRVF
jgi:multiple antibiotic resistance protein